VGELVLGARAEIEKQRKPGFLEWAIKKVTLEWVLMSPGRVEMATIPLRLYQQLGLQWLVRKTRLLHRLPGPFKTLAVMEELLPKLPGRPLRSIIDEVTPAKGERAYQVGFFLGCVMNVVFAESSQSTLNVLVENGCEVVTPKAQKCCGAPHAGEGDFKSLRELARQNVDLFSKWELDYIVADCAACSAETKKYGELLEDEPEYADRARAFSAKVRDISEFLAMIPLRQPKGEVNKRVTYHEACHLCHAQGVSKEPREMIESVPGVELVEMKEADWCCGSAGVYNLTHPDRAEKILERKMGNATATGAEIVVTGNPGCLMQLEAGARRYNEGTKVLHPVQLLDAAYQGVEEPAGSTRRK
jgi:glycolate oxidase iron-sulfur subunit